MMKAKYFLRILNIGLHRWPKLVFNALYTVNGKSNIRWKWLQSIDDMLCKNDASVLFKTNLNANDNKMLSILKQNHIYGVNNIWYECLYKILLE